MYFREATPQRVYHLRLVRGEAVLETLTAFCAQEKIVHANVTAIGAIERAVVGAYLLEKKEYVKQEYAGIWEVCSLMGNVALVEGEPFIHAHVVLSNEQNETVGGHLFGGFVGVTLEVVVTGYREPLTRATDERIGLRLLALEDM